MTSLPHGPAQAGVSSPAPDSRTGLVAFWKGYDRKKTLRAAQVADEAGYHSFWVAEAWGYEAFSLLTEIACHTKRIRLGTGIVNVFSRSPGLLAMSAATLNEISEGRFILGLGTSAQQLVQEFHGTTFQRPLARLRETIQTVRKLLRGEPISTTPRERGRAVSLGVPRRFGDIPIYCGTLHPRAIEMTGELADGWIPMFWSYRQLDLARKWLRRGADAAGRDSREITVAPFTAIIPDGSAFGTRTARRMLAFYVGGMGPYFHSALANMGLGEGANRVRTLWGQNRWRDAEQAVTEEMVEALGIFGDVEYCREQLHDRRRFGADLPIVSLPVGVDIAATETYIRTFAPNA